MFQTAKAILVKTKLAIKKIFYVKKMKTNKELELLVKASVAIHYIIGRIGSFNDCRGECFSEDSECIESDVEAAKYMLKHIAGGLVNMKIRHFRRKTPLWRRLLAPILRKTGTATLIALELKNGEVLFRFVRRSTHCDRLYFKYDGAAIYLAECNNDQEKIDILQYRFTTADHVFKTWYVL